MNRSLLRSLMMAAALAPSATRGAMAQVDTIGPPKPLFTDRDAWLGVAFGAMTLAVRPIDRHFAERLQSPHTQENRFLQKTAAIVRTIADPGSVIIGTSMYAIGRISGNDRLADLGLHGTEALAVGEGTAWVLKGAFGRERPYVNPKDPNPLNWQFLRGFGGGDGYRSFPSGHTVGAFAAASAVANETSRWWPDTRWPIGALMYGGATAVGISRMYNNRHWASDVVVGAAIGTFAGNKVVRYHHTHPGNRTDKWLLSGRVTPRGGLGTLSLSITPISSETAERFFARR